MSHKILVSDPISEDGLQSILKHPEFDVDIQTDLSENDLVNMISTYDAHRTKSNPSNRATINRNKEGHCKSWCRCG